MDHNSKRPAVIVVVCVVAAIAIGLGLRTVFAGDDYSTFCNNARQVESALASTDPGSSANLEALFVAAADTAPNSLQPVANVFVRQRTGESVSPEEAAKAREQWASFVESECGVVRSALHPEAVGAFEDDSGTEGI